ncbi:MAG TPA: type II toxin-antitoxin system HipA family toxin [Bacilli bacterium]|nr:type II toxin-antitoxin system HipA family toxin [Bacilli bacterium]
MTTAEVKLWGTRIGAVSIEDDSTYCVFRYDPEFAKSGKQLSPLMMPLSEDNYTFTNLPLTSFNGLPGLLADSLPDKFGNTVIDAWLDSLGRSRDSFNAVERLCYIGTRGMGALEFFSNMRENMSKDEKIKLEQLIQISNDVLLDRMSVSAKGTEALKQLINVGTSAGGARPKAILAYNDKTKEFRTGQVDVGQGFSYWIVKFDGVSNKVTQHEDNLTMFTRIEYAYYLMAIAAGIKMSESRLYHEGDLFHFMTKRFDRVEVDGKVEKLHMQTLAALIHRDYNDAGTVSYEYVVQVMNLLQLPASEIRQFFKRMVFNVMARNQDDHIKNIAFLMGRDGKWNLSPAYDMTYAHNPTGKWTAAHQMLINGKKSNITLEDIMHSASVMNIKLKDAKKIIAEVTAAILQWDQFAKTAKLDEQTTVLIQKDFILLPTNNLEK